MNTEKINDENLETSNNILKDSPPVPSSVIDIFKPLLKADTQKVLEKHDCKTTEELSQKIIDGKISIREAEDINEYLENLPYEYSYRNCPEYVYPLWPKEHYEGKLTLIGKVEPPKSSDKIFANHDGSILSFGFPGFALYPNLNGDTYKMEPFHTLQFMQRDREDNFYVWSIMEGELLKLSKDSSGYNKLSNFPQLNLEEPVSNIKVFPNQDVVFGYSSDWGLYLGKLNKDLVYEKKLIGGLSTPDKSNYPEGLKNYPQVIEILPKDRILTVGRFGTISIWEPRNNFYQERIVSDEAGHVTFTTPLINGDVFAINGLYNNTIWKLSNDGFFEKFPLKNQATGIVQYVFPSGDLISTSVMDNSVMTLQRRYAYDRYKVETLIERNKLIKSHIDIYTVSVFPNGNIVLLCTDGSIYIYE